MLLSVIIPMFNEEEICLRTYETLEKVLKDVEHELLFVDDGSTDRTRELLLGAIPEGSANRVISFSRNFGHQAAFSAGLDQAKGDAVAIIDGDLQDPPELILDMLAKWREGWQVVYGQRRARAGEGLFKKLTAAGFYRSLRLFTSVDIPVDTGDFRLMDRVVVDVLKSLPERSRFLRGLVPWVGFRQTGILYDRAERTAGETKYPLKKMLKLAGDGIASFSSLPLRLSLWIGLVAAGLGGLLAVWAVVSKFALDGTVPGWTSLLIAVVFLGGVQLITIGVMGEYVGRIYDEVKQRPLYVLRKDSPAPEEKR